MSAYAVAPMPGRYSRVPYAEYARWGYVRQSQLRPLLEGASPIHYLYALQHPQPPTDPMRLGLALHCAILTPELRTAQMVASPVRARRSSLDRAWWTRWEQEHADQIRLDPGQLAALDAMVAAIARDPVASLLLSQADAEREVSYVWDYDPQLSEAREYRLRVQGRPDYELRAEGIIADLKTCRSAALRTFTREIRDRYYHVQAALYRQMAMANGWEPSEYLFLCAENEPPYCTVVRPLSAALWAEGWDLAEVALTTLARCQRTGQFHGYELETMDPA